MTYSFVYSDITLNMNYFQSVPFKVTAVAYQKYVSDLRFLQVLQLLVYVFVCF